MNYKHGLSNHKLYSTWKDMFTRCNNPTKHNYKNYGGKGIKVCEEWNNVENFISWAENNGHRDDLTLDRISSDEDYSPSNCKWSSNFEQSRNKVSNRFYDLNGETKILTDWCKIYNINFYTVSGRLKKGLSIYEALTLPSLRGKKIIIKGD